MSARTAKPNFCQVASNLDSHPKIRKAGRNGREVFLFALRRNAEPGNPIMGQLPAAVMESWYLADQLMMSVTECDDGLSRAQAADLLHFDGSVWHIVGWEEHWGARAADGAERTAKWRDSKKATPRDVTVTSPTSRNVTRDGCDALDKSRGEEKREEDLRPPIPQGGNFAVGDSPGHEPEKLDLAPELLAALKATTDREAPRANRRRSRKPVELTDEERESARVVLEKLSARNGVKYSGSLQHQRLIANQLRAGVSEMELRAVIGYCAMELEWADKPEMAKYLRPETLFGPQTIARYLDPARTWYASLPDEASPSTLTKARAAPAPRIEHEPSWLDEGMAS